MSLTHEILDGGEKVTTRWWIDRAVNRDCYDLFIVRYHEPVQDREDGERWATWSEVLDPDCRWRVVDEGQILQPTMSLNGILVHTLANLDGLLDRQDISHALSGLCARIIMSTVAVRAGDES